ncbi:hypothetical protein ACFL5H_01870 [Candidatus Latescibacterota bacterium]
MVLDTLARLQEALRSIRRQTPAQTFSTTAAALSDVRIGYLDGRPVRRLVVTLRALGCSWTQASGGCVMCGHWVGTTRGISPGNGDSLAQFRSEIAKYDLRNISVLSIYNSGSMLNPGELAPEALINLLAEIRTYPSIRKIVLETRAEYVDEAYVRELAAVLAPQARLSIAMGLETADDMRRELCLNKGCSAHRIEDAIELIREIADFQLYVLAGLPFLTEAEAIEDAIDAVRLAHRIGADEIHIEPMTIQQHTLVEALAQEGLYRLPSLYTLFEILRRVVPDIRPYVSPFMHMPLPERIPEGCPSCTARLREQLLWRYNITRDTASLEYDFCDCIPAWRARLCETDPRPLEQRVREALEVLSCGVLSC